LRSRPALNASSPDLPIRPTTKVLLPLEIGAPISGRTTVEDDDRVDASPFGEEERVDEDLILKRVREGVEEGSAHVKRACTHNVEGMEREEAEMS